MNTRSDSQTSFISSLKSLAQNREATENDERCSFCGNAIPEDHRHFLHVETNKFLCSCELCAVKQAETGKYRPVSTRKRYLKDVDFPDSLWTEFMIPVSMAFFVNSSRENGVVAYYPAPTGATESKLKMEPWQKLAERNPILKSMNPDVEALLVNRTDEANEHFLVPIDVCYRLIGAIRVAWKGLFGGKEVDRTIRTFFDDLKNQAAHA